MPPDWWPAIAEYLQAQLSKETAVTIDQNGNVLPEDGSIPPFLDRTQGRSKEEIDAERDRLIAQNSGAYRRKRVAAPIC
jgi:hypothetical protein